MKHNSYFIVLLLLPMIIGSHIFAQTPEKNLAKYWNYKNRIKYFVNPTSDNTLYNRGEGLIMATRNISKGERVTYGQQNVWLGYYIGVLATEYKLFHDNGQWVDATNTQREINRELDALIRKDNCETFPPWYKVNNSWDGFFVRDDIFSEETWDINTLHGTSSFLSTYDLNFGLTSSDNCTNVSKGNPAYISSINEIVYHADGSRYNPNDDNAMSQDEAIGLLLGLALVKKYAPYNEMVKAEQITDKIILKIRDNDGSGVNWAIRDPNHNVVSNYNWPYSAPYAYGFAKAGTYITNNALSHYLTTFGEFGRKAIWNDIVQLNDVGSSNRWMGTVLGAIGNSWKTGIFISTIGTIYRKGSYDDWYPFYLYLYAVLHDKSINFIKNELVTNGTDFDTKATTDNNKAPCRGPYCFTFGPGGTEDHSPDNWGSSLRFTHEWKRQVHGESGNPGVFSGVDYMLLYNLYHIVNAADLPPYVNTNDRTVYGTWPVWPQMWAHPIATNDYPLTVNALTSITSTMIINNNLGSDPDKLGNITYRAGELIDLKPGFAVTNGATFHGYISPFDPCSGGSKSMSEDNNLLCAYDSVMMLTQPAFPAYVPTISGRLSAGGECSNNSLAFDTLLLVVNGHPNYIHIDTSIIVNFNTSDSTSLDTVIHIKDNFLTNGIGIVTDSSGAFSFERTDLMDLDSNLRYSFVSKSGSPITDTSSKTIGEWIRGGSVSLTLQNVNLVWAKRYNLADSSWAVAKAMDINGNIYVTGYAYSSEVNYDIVTLKYNPKGDLKWANFYDGVGMEDSPTAITVDSLCNIYVTGFTATPDYMKCITIKYDSGGTQQWANKYNGSAGYDETMGYAIVTDNKSNVYVTGRTQFSGPDDIFTIKYNAGGGTEWVARYDDAMHGEDFGKAIATDGQNVYVCGEGINGQHQAGYVIIKYNANGAMQWINTYTNGTINSYYENSYDILFDKDSSVLYVAGPIGLLKYSSAGTLLWSKQGNAQFKVVEDNNTDLHVANRGGFTEYDKDGNILINVANIGLYLRDIAVDSAGNDYVVYNGNGGSFVSKYSNGALTWSVPFNFEYYGEGNSIAVSDNKNVYVFGISMDNYKHRDLITVKYSQCPDQANNLRVHYPTTTTTENAQQAKEIKVMVVPNPNNGTMLVYYNLKDPSPAFFEIYDLTGRKVFSQQLNVESRSITISQQQLIGGVYMYTLVQNNAVVAFDKMVIIK
jgi:hypothetical protein